MYKRAERSLLYLGAFRKAESPKNEGFDAPSFLQGANIMEYQDTKVNYIKEIFQWVEAFLFAILIALLIRGFVLEPVYVDGPSMEPTLYTGQRLVVYKTGYYFAPPQRGDIVVLQYQEGITRFIPFLENLPLFKKALPSIREVDYIKRVIAVPDDTLEIRDGYVYVNGEKIDEPYIREQGATLGWDIQKPMIIPKNNVFVMGDNRQESRDSRQIGLIEFNRIKGKAVLRIWPLKEFGGME